MNLTSHISNKSQANICSITSLLLKNLCRINIRLHIDLTSNNEDVQFPLLYFREIYLPKFVRLI